jgi:hypothetical protein
MLRQHKRVSLHAAVVALEVVAITHHDSFLNYYRVISNDASTAQFSLPTGALLAMYFSLGRRMPSSEQPLRGTKPKLH